MEKWFNRNKCFFCIPIEWAIIASSVLVIAISILLLVVTGLHKNAMTIHLPVINRALPAIYYLILGLTILIETFGLIAMCFPDKHPKKLILVRVYVGSYFFMLVVILWGWQITNFVFAFLNQAKTLAACNAANPTKSGTGTTSATPVKISGKIYGFSSCDTAVTSGIAGILALLLTGIFIWTYVWYMVLKYTIAAGEVRKAKDAESKSKTNQGAAKSQVGVQPKTDKEKLAALQASLKTEAGLHKTKKLVPRKTIKRTSNAPKNERI